MSTEQVHTTDVQVHEGEARMELVVPKDGEPFSPKDVLFKPYTLANNANLCRLLCEDCELSYVECPHCTEPLQITKQYILSAVNNRTEYIRKKMRIVKCMNCFTEYKFGLKKTNTYLLVPYRYKDDARRMGAMYDPDVKLWYISAKAPPMVGHELLKRYKKVIIDMDELAKDFMCTENRCDYNS